MSRLLGLLLRFEVSTSSYLLDRLVYESFVEKPLLFKPPVDTASS